MLSKPIVCVVLGVRCTIRDGKWGSSSVPFTAMLNSKDKLLDVLRVPIGNVPSLDYARALRMVKELGGEVQSPPPEIPYDSKVDY